MPLSKGPTCFITWTTTQKTVQMDDKLLTGWWYFPFQERNCYVTMYFSLIVTTSISICNCNSFYVIVPQIKHKTCYFDNPIFLMRISVLIWLIGSNTTYQQNFMLIISAQTLIITRLQSENQQKRKRFVFFPYLNLGPLKSESIAVINCALLPTLIKTLVWLYYNFNVSKRDFFWQCLHLMSIS
jgi:hypothetical protein